jgi:hypothetical protein
MPLFYREDFIFWMNMALQHLSLFLYFSQKKDTPSEGFHAAKPRVASGDTCTFHSLIVYPARPLPVADGTPA